MFYLLSAKSKCKFCTLKLENNRVYGIIYIVGGSYEQRKMEYRII